MSEHPYGLAVGQTVRVKSKRGYHRFKTGDICIYMGPSSPSKRDNVIFKLILQGSEDSLEGPFQQVLYLKDFEPVEKPSSNRQAVSLINLSES